MMKRLSLMGVVAMALVTIYWFGITSEAQTTTKPSKTTSEDQVSGMHGPPKTDWDLLIELNKKSRRELEDFVEIFECGDYKDVKIKKLTLQWYGRGGRLADRKPKEIKTTNKRRLREARNVLYYGPLLRDFQPLSGMGGVGGEARCGFLLIQTNKGVFTIAITQMGFVVGKELNFHKLFFSWGLAAIVKDMMHNSECGKMSSDLFQTLSGLAIIDRSRKVYETANMVDLPRED